MDEQKLNTEKNERPFHALKQASTLAHLIMRRLLESNPAMTGDFPKLTPVQVMVLRHLVLEDGLPQNRLAEITGKDNPGMTRILDNMEKQEIIYRQRSKEDRRVSNIFLTPKAEAMIQRMEPFFDELITIAFRDFSEEEIILFASMCKRIRKNCQSEINRIDKNRNS